MKRFLTLVTIVTLLSMAVAIALKHVSVLRGAR
jgi:hypothetical protein